MLEILQGDITTCNVDAIVNAANNNLQGGGGVDGAIHRAAGAELLEACQSIGFCATGKAVYTKGYQLPARYVIHTVGPVWRGGNQGEDELLARCYVASLKLAAQLRLQSIAFPSISTGAYGYPLEAAADVAISTVIAFLQQADNKLSLQRVLMVCFDQASLRAYQNSFQRITSPS